MSSCIFRTMLAVLLVSLPAGAQNAAAPLAVNPLAALIEVLPPESIQNSPAATELVDRMIRKHVLLLQHPGLMAQVLKSGKIKNERWTDEKDRGAADKLLSAVKVRAMPDTNIIELLVDPRVAGDDAAAVAEAIVNQHLENQNVVGQNKQLERAVMLNNLKQRYQFRKDELGRDLREKTLQLSIDGMGMPGRLSARELELQKLIDLRFELERKKLEAADKPAIETQLQQLAERIDRTKADLGALTNAMDQYLRIRDDEQTTRALLQEINRELEQIGQRGNMSLAEIQWLAHPVRN